MYVNVLFLFLCRDTFSISQFCIILGSGDSGGPLVDVHTNTLVGIAEAVNSGGCGIGQPDIFIRVSTFYYWIERQTKSDLSTNTVPAVVKIPTFQGK